MKETDVPFVERLLRLMGKVAGDGGAESEASTAELLTKFDAIATAGDSPQAVSARQFGFVREQIRANPLSFFQELRAHRPILRAGPVWLVARRRDVEEILHRETIFSVQSYSPRMTGVIGPFVLSLDITPEYDHDISAMRLAVRREDLDRVRRIVQSHAGRIVAEHARADAPFDIVQTLTRMVPIRLAEEYYGFRAPDEATMARWARSCFHEFFQNLDNDPAVRSAALEAGGEMRSWLHELIERRRAESDPGDDVLGRLLRQQKGGPGLGFNDEGVVRTMMGLVIGMLETTSQAAVQALLVLTKRPERLAEAQAAARAGDDERLAAYVFEALRFAPVNPLVVRTLTEDYRLGSGERHETILPKGAVVFALTWSAMFDERMMEAPDEFRPGRARDQYLHFVTGRHACFGRYISRIQIPGILKPLLAGDGLRLAGAPVHAGPFPDRLEVAVTAGAPVSTS